MNIFKNYATEDGLDPIEARTHNMSSKYKQVNTAEAIGVFKDNGFEVMGTSAAKPRAEHRKGYQKHVVAFTRDDLVTGGGEQLQLLLTNSHDGTTSFRLDSGIFRFVCANGLVVGDTAHTTRIKHVGDCLNQIDKAIKYQLERLPQVAAEIERFKGIILGPDTVADFSMRSAELRIPEVKVLIPVRARRSADLSNDLWTVYNRVQEILIRGGLRYMEKGGDFKTLRKISSIDTVSKVNKELWNLAKSFAA